MFPIGAAALLAFIEDYLALPPVAGNTTTATGDPANDRSAEPVTNYDRVKWDALVKFDAEIATVFERLRPMGHECIDELASSYLALNDKQYLSQIELKVTENAKARAEAREQKAKEDEEERERQAATLKSIQESFALDEARHAEERKQRYAAWRVTLWRYKILLTGVLLSLAAVGGYLHYQKVEERKAVALKEQQAEEQWLRAEAQAEQRELAAAEESRRQANARQEERVQAERVEATAAAARLGDMLQQPRIRVGDRHTFETTDMLDSRLNNVVAREVVSISGDEVIMKLVNQKSSYERFLTYNRDLGLVRSRYGQGDGVDYSPAIKYVQVPGRIGDSWVSKSTETNIKTGKTRAHVMRARIEGSESVTVPAGTFETFRIVIDSEVEDDGKVSSGQDISWFSPQVGRSVKSELRSTDATGKAGHRVVQLVSYSLGP